MRCPACGSSVPDDARFCPACGQTVQSRADERRVVSVLFADLVGFTSLSEHADPEQVKNLVDRCFQDLVADINSYGGRVDKILGDGIIALFGTPVAHEDDAERAVRAALAMRTTLTRISAQRPDIIQMRIGINTGEVLVGAVAGGESTVMGDVVNSASRLQTAAEPGQILVGHSTYTATNQVIRYEPMVVVQARGRSEPIEAWPASAAILPPGQRRRRTRTPLVGRDAELGLLGQAFRIAAGHKRPGLVLVLGEAGLGKSRLAEEAAALAVAEHGALVLEGRCLPYGEANPWWPVAEAIRSACGVDDDDDVDRAYKKCLAAVAATLGHASASAETERLAHGLLYIMGHERPDLSLANVDPARARDEALRSVRLLLEGLGAERPVLIVLSELHWADGMLLSAMDKFIDRIRDAKVVLLATARPELLERWSAGPGNHNTVTLRLDPLDRTAVEGMIDALLGSQLPARVRDMLLERSGGNPFFLEEMVSFLDESGALVTREGAVQLDVTRQPAQLPPTLRGLVAARLDALPPDERALLEDAAVIGRSGPIALLRALAKQRSAPVAASLDALISKDLLGVQGEEFEFKSDLVRSIAYETLTKGTRARIHAAVAGWLSERARDSGREDEFLEQLAHHYGEAATFAQELGIVEGVPADIRPHALQVLERAAARAEMRDAPRLSAHLLDHAVALLRSQDGATKRRVLLRRAHSRAGLRELAAAREDLDIVLEEAQAAKDDRAMAGALTVLGEIEHHEGAYERSVQSLRRAVTMWRGLGDHAGLAQALRSLGETEMFHGNLDGAEQPTAEAMELYRGLEDRRGEAWGQRNLAWIAFMRGDFTAAEERLNTAANTFAEIGDRGGLGWAIGFLAWVRFMEGRLDEAASLAEPMLEESDEVGDPFAGGMLYVLLGTIRMWSGSHKDGHVLLARARDIFRSIGDAWGEIQALIPMGLGLVTAGCIDEGIKSLQDADTLAVGIRDDRIRAFVYTACGQAQALVGEGARALAEHDRMKAVFGDVDLPGAGEFKTARGLALLQLGRVDEALDLLDPQVVAAGPPTAGLRANLAGLRGLAYAAAGRPADAHRSASEIASIQGGTSRDRMVASLALGLAAAQTGRLEEAEAHFADATARVDATDATLDQAVVRLARAHALEALGSPDAVAAMSEARRRLAELHVAAAGWDTLFMLAATGDRRRADSLGRAGA